MTDVWQRFSMFNEHPIGQKKGQKFDVDKFSENGLVLCRNMTFVVIDFWQCRRSTFSCWSLLTYATRQDDRTIEIFLSAIAIRLTSNDDRLTRSASLFAPVFLQSHCSYSTFCSSIALFQPHKQLRKPLLQWFLWEACEKWEQQNSFSSVKRFSHLLLLFLIFFRRKNKNLVQYNPLARTRSFAITLRKTRDN